MRHDIKYQQSHSSASRQRPGTVNGLNDHTYRYHHGSHYRSNGINGYSASNIDEHGGTVSALSGGETHEAQKQWEWLEAVLDKSSRNKETVCLNLLYTNTFIRFSFTYFFFFFHQSFNLGKKLIKNF